MNERRSNGWTAVEIHTLAAKLMSTDCITQVVDMVSADLLKAGKESDAATLHEAAQRLRAMDGERIGYVSLSDFKRAVGATGEMSDPTTPASMSPSWRDSIPVIIRDSGGE